MSATDADLVTRLDRQFDTLLLGADAPGDQIDPELTAVLRHMQTLASRPTPDATFVHRLQEELRGSTGDSGVEPWRSAVGARHAVPTPRHRSPNGDAPRQRPRPWWQRLEIAAALLVVVVLAGYFAVADQGRRAARPSHSAGIEIPPAAISSVPVRLRIDAIGVDAAIERLESASEPRLIPRASGPWVVAWREDSAAPGEGGNIVLDGHLDYWTSGPAVFWDLENLTVGDRIDVIGANHTLFSYTVDWLRLYPLEAGEEQRQEILGPTPSESLTLITDAGEFDATTNSYPEVLVVRARFESVSSLPTPVTPDPSECQVEPRTIADLDAGAATVVARTDEVLEILDSTEGFVTFADEPLSAEVRAAVIAAEREFVACLNANDPLRIAALYSDDGLLRLLNFTSGLTDPISPTLEWTPDFSELALPATPVPADNRLALLAVDEIRVLDDGRVMAKVTIGPGNSGTFGAPIWIPVMHIFEQGDRYLIDEFTMRASGTPTP